MSENNGLSMSTEGKAEVRPLLEVEMARHSPAKMLLILLTAVMFIVMVSFNGLAATSSGGGIFLNNTGDVADLFYLEITPAGWTFSIWGFIYAWQGAWLVYALTTICRRKVSTYLYQLPVYPAVIFVCYIINNICNVGWLFAWDRQQLAIALPLIALTPFTLYICLFFSCKRLVSNFEYMIKNGLTVDLWLVRMLIQNGIAFYAAWVTVATLINFGAVLTYKDGSDVTDIGVAQDVSSTVVLAVVAFEIALWFVLDIFFLDRYTRYLFTPYMTLTVAMAGIVQKNYDLDNAYRNSVFSVVLLVVAGICLVAKVTTLVYRHVTRPVLSTTIKPTI